MLVDSNKSIKDIHIRTARWVLRRSLWKDTSTAVLYEFVNSATFAAGIASVCIAIKNGRDVHISGSIATYHPIRPSVFPIVAANERCAQEAEPLLLQLQHYYEQVEWANSIPLGALKPRYAISPIEMADWVHLANVWSSSCSAALMALHLCFDPDFKIDVTVKQKLINLHELLSAIRAGQSPCVRGDGMLIVAGKFDERSHERYKIGARVLITSGGVSAVAILQDISASGMGIAFAPEINAGELITVQLDSGRKLSGVIAWSHGGRLGVQLDARLLDNDPLLTPPALPEQFPSSGAAI